MLFIEESSPPPFYQPHLTPKQRIELDKWFIGKRSQTYYLKRFKAFDEQGFLSPKWHWASFFATYGWLLYRKRYLDCIVYTVAGWSFIQLNVVMLLVTFEFLFMSWIPSDFQMMTRVALGVLVWIFWSIIVARWSDAYYYRMARREIADALSKYPKDVEEQKKHLQREGGVSQFGLVMALGIFLFSLLVIQVQFLPLYAKPKEKAIIQQSFAMVQSTANHVESMYQVHKKCPVNTKFDTSNYNLELKVVQNVRAWAKPQSDCAVIATIKDIEYPNRNLNGQTIILYRPLKSESEQNVKWLCDTSLNKKLRPIRCKGE